MKNILTAIFLCLSIGAFAQNLTKDEFDKNIKPINDKLKTLQTQNAKLKGDVDKLSSKLLKANLSLDSIKKLTKTNSESIAQTGNELGIKIKETGRSNEDKISAVDKSLSKTSLLGVIGVLLALLISGALYWLLSSRQKSDKTDIIDQLSKTKSSIEESLVKEFGKQTELMDSQMQLIELQKKSLTSSHKAEPDHSLALKVADELTLIERNISLMDASTKGLKQLSRSVDKIKDNLTANGYEIPILLGKPFNQGMKIVPVSTIPDESLDSGVEIISKVIKPQVNYNDKMIQPAQIEVSVGY